MATICYKLNELQKERLNIALGWLEHRPEDQFDMDRWISSYDWDAVAELYSRPVEQRGTAPVCSTVACFAGDIALNVLFDSRYQDIVPEDAEIDIMEALIGGELAGVFLNLPKCISTIIFTSASNYGDYDDLACVTKSDVIIKLIQWLKWGELRLHTIEWQDIHNSFTYVNKHQLMPDQMSIELENEDEREAAIHFDLI